MLEIETTSALVEKDRRGSITVAGVLAAGGTFGLFEVLGLRGIPIWGSALALLLVAVAYSISVTFLILALIPRPIKVQLQPEGVCYLYRGGRVRRMDWKTWTKHSEIEEVTRNTGSSRFPLGTRIRVTGPVSYAIWIPGGSLTSFRRILSDCGYVEEKQDWQLRTIAGPYKVGERIWFHLPS
jgi:hypothetical protein